jgi:hypothetical protein
LLEDVVGGARGDEVALGWVAELRRIGDDGEGEVLFGRAEGRSCVYVREDNGEASDGFVLTDVRAVEELDADVVVVKNCCVPSGLVRTTLSGVPIRVTASLKDSSASLTSSFDDVDFDVD